MSWDQASSIQMASIGSAGLVGPYSEPVESKGGEVGTLNDLHFITIIIPSVLGQSFKNVCQCSELLCIHITDTSNCFLYVSVTALQNVATVQCTFLDGQPYRCLINCASEQFGSYSRYVLTESGLVVSGVLYNLTSGHRYYCKAVPLNTAISVSTTVVTNFATLSAIKGNKDLQRECLYHIWLCF